MPKTIILQLDQCETLATVYILLPNATDPILAFGEQLPGQNDVVALESSDEPGYNEYQVAEITTHGELKEIRRLIPLPAGTH